MYCTASPLQGPIHQDFTILSTSMKSITQMILKLYFELVTLSEHRILLNKIFIFPFLKKITFYPYEFSVLNHTRRIGKSVGRPMFMSQWDGIKYIIKFINCMTTD